MKNINFFNKFFNRKLYKKNKIIYRRDEEKKIYNLNIKNKLEKIELAINEKKEINFLHSGHIGDIINSLPVIKKLSETHICNLIIEINKPVPIHYFEHPSGQLFMNKHSFDMLYPLLKNQTYISLIDIFDKQKIDIDLNIIREMPLSFEFDSMKYSFHVAGIQADLNLNFLTVNEHPVFKERIIIQRSLRRQNHLINYNFLVNYEPALFIGTKREYLELKKDLANLEFYECKNFLEMAEIIKSSKLFIGNSSLGFTIAEGLKTPRLLESCPWSSPQQIHGLNGYDFFFSIAF